MKTSHKRTLFQKVLVPVMLDCDQGSAVKAAQAVAGRGNVVFAGILYIPDGKSLSTAAGPARQIRKNLRQILGVGSGASWGQIHASHDPWSQLVDIVEKEKPELLILQWPSQFEALQTSLSEVLLHPPCDIAIVNGRVPDRIRSILVPLRGGPYAELALRAALSINQIEPTEISSLHIYSPNRAVQKDAAFRGIDRVLKNLAEVERREVVTDDPAETIFDTSRKFDLVIMGVSARPAKDTNSIGPVAERIMNESKKGVMVVKTKKPPPGSLEKEESGQAAISVLVDKWFAENTFHADEFMDLDYLLYLKQEQGITISLALPALNEQATVRKVIKSIQSSLMVKRPLLDEIVLIDSNSTDGTRDIARSLGIPVYVHQDTLPEYGSRSGKGEALWKSLFCTRGDIVIWLDTDILNIHPRFVYGLIGPMLLRPDIHFVKGFYRRPLKVGNRVQAASGGRVTELSARPLLNLFYPELSGVIQPLAGEYGGRRQILEKLPFFSGYGVEIGLLIDVLNSSGLGAIAQVDLQERIHHNQPLEALSKMSFAIIQAVIRKLEARYGQTMLENVNKTMKLIRYEQQHFFLDIEEVAESERPPMLELPEYRERRNW